MDNELTSSLNSTFETNLPLGLREEDLERRLSAYINDLINTDFQKLVYYLYRIDVSEAKLTGLLKEYPQERAGDIIAALIIERQAEKIKSRKDFKRDHPGGEDERW